MRITPSAASDCTKSSTASATWRGRADEGLAAGDLDDQVADGQVAGLGPAAPLGGGGDRVGVHAGPALDDRGRVDVGLDLGQGAVGVVAGQVPVPHLLQQQDGGLGADLLAADVAGALGRLLGRVPQGEGGGGDDLELLGPAPVAGEAALDVGVERPGGVGPGVAREDGVGGGRGQLAPGVAVARLEDDRVALRAAGRREPAPDVDVAAGVLELAAVRVPHAHRGPDHLARPLVAVGVVEVAAAAEVLAGEGVGRRDHVPPRPPAGEVVERGQLAGQLVGLVEGGVERARQPQVGGHRGQGRQHGHGVGPAHHVEVVDPAALLPQAQALGQEEEVEAAPLGHPGQVLERGEVDLAARPGVGPHGGVVHPGEVRGQDHRLARPPVAPAHACAPGVAGGGPP